MNRLLLFAFLLMAAMPARATLYPMRDDVTVLCFLRNSSVDRALMPVLVGKIAELCTIDQAAGDLGAVWYDTETASMVRGHWEHSVFVKELPLPAERWQYMGRGVFQK